MFFLFVFIGHGVPAKDGKDGLLVGADAQQDADLLYARSLPQTELLGLLAPGKQARSVLLLDTCFSGRTPEGRPLAKGLQSLVLKVDPGKASLTSARAVLLTAARSDQFAGPLPGAARPAFSYLALGGLRGWADDRAYGGDGDGEVTAEELSGYASTALRALQATQEPELLAWSPGQVLSTGGERGPDLGAMVRDLRPAPDGVIPDKDKAQWSRDFIKAYGSSKRENPYADELKKYAGAAGIEWVTVAGGDFMMGSNTGESDEKPVHRVSVRTFEMAKTEVTFGQYRACVEAGACAAAHAADGTCWFYNGSGWGQGKLPESFQGDEQPVVCVDWEQAGAFARWAGGRLPTEAEWEYAARGGGKDREYPWGNEKAACDRAVIGDDGGLGCGRNATWPACSKTAGNTEQGLCDMAGNVWEWVEDWYHDSYGGAPTDGSAWVSPTDSHRVLRGGSWISGAADARSADRNDLDPGNRYVILGFRPARSP